MIGQFISIVCASITLIVCLILIFCSHYVDGLVGRLSLSLLAIGSFARISGLLDQPEHSVSSVGVIIWLGIALFFSRHLYRFLVRYARRGPHWYDPPRIGIRKRGIGLMK